MGTKVGNSGGRSSCLGSNLTNKKVRNKKVEPYLCCAAFNLHVYAGPQAPELFWLFFYLAHFPKHGNIFNFNG